jgi:NAD+ synthase
MPVAEGDRYRTFSLVVEAPDGRRTEVRLTSDAYLAIVAATNFKQRVRKMMEYHYADRFQYAVVGTPNLLEYDQGFFVKNGDGAADLKPIAHLYKTQVYQLAEFLGVPEDVRRRPPTTDTFSLAQTQEEFFFSVPYQTLDVCLYGLNHGLAADELARCAGLSPALVEQVYREIESKRRATAYLHASPLLVNDERGGKAS